MNVKYEDYGDDNKTGIITKRFSYVDEIWAWKNGVSGLAIPLLNFIIHNWIAGKKRKLRLYDKNDVINSKYAMSIHSLARAWKIDRTSLVRAKQRLVKIKIDNEKLILEKTVGSDSYLGINASLFSKMIVGNSMRFIHQCEYWKRYDILNSNILEEFVKPLFDFTDSNEKVKHSKWAESVVRELCVMANKENAQLYKNGKIVNVFSHLKDGQFKKQRKGIDTACKLIDDLYTGRFFRDNPIHLLFGEINQEHVEYKNAKSAVEKIMYLKGDKEGIKKFLCRCAKNYFIACRPGQETYKEIKTNFPVSIKDFILFNDYKGNHVANFLLFYLPTLSAKDKQVNDLITRIKKLVPESVFNILRDYEDYLLEKHIQSYWINIYKITKKIKSIINSKGTSYGMNACFDILFKKVDVISERYKKVLPGYFDPEQETANNAIIEMKSSR